MTDLAREKSWCTLISLTCKGSSKQRYTIQSYPVNWHFHSIIPHPKNKTYIRKTMVSHDSKRRVVCGGSGKLIQITEMLPGRWPKHNAALKHNVPCFHVLFGSILCVKYEGEILKTSQTEKIAHHRTFQPTFSDITVSFLRSTLYYVLYQAYTMYLGRNKCASILQGLPDPDSPFSD